MSECKLIQTRDGNWIPLVSRNSERYYFGSTFDGEFAANRWSEYYIDDSVENVILFGIGDCQIVNDVIGKIRGRVIVYEPDEAIFYEMEKTDIFRRISSRRVNVIYGKNRKGNFERAVVELLNWDCEETTVMISHPGYKRFYEKEYKEVEECYLRIRDKARELNEEMSALVRQITENELDNLPYIKDGIPVGRLAQYWNPDIPIIFIGAGPSLLKNIEMLKEVGHRAFLFCCDSALPVLLRHDIVPNLVGTIDAMKSPSWFEEEKSCDIAHYVISCSCHDVVKKLKGHKIWGYDNMTWNLLMKKQNVELPVVPVWEGVAPHLFAFIRELGTKQIVFVGHDLAYSDTNESYADGRKKNELDEINIEVEGYYGGIVRSRPDWNKFREFFESMMRTIPEDISVINATEGGAKIHGMRQSTLSKVIDELPDRQYDFEKILSDVRVHLTENEYKGIMTEFNLFDQEIKEWQKRGYYEILFEQNISESPLIGLVLGYMKAFHGEGVADRKMRFERALDLTYYAIRKRMIAWGGKELADDELLCELDHIADCFYREQIQEGIGRFLNVAVFLSRLIELSELDAIFDAIELKDYILAADLIHGDKRSKKIEKK